MCNKLGSSVDELVFSRAEEWREMIEDFSLLQKGVPVEEQHGNDTWEMSLRDAWTKFVPVGNNLSGIYLPISLKSDTDMSNFVKVRQPAGARMRTQQLTQKLMSGKKHGTISTKTWKEGLGGELFRQRQRKYRRQLQRLWPHEPEFEELEVHGYRPGTSTATLLRSADTDLPDPELEPPEPEVAAEEEAAAEAAVAAAPVGPSLDFESRRVLLECTLGKLATSTIEARNSGSTALYYTWNKIAKPNVLGKKEDGVQRLWFAAKPGVVLPGRTISLAFNFLSEIPGQWTQEWELTTQPPLPGGAVRVRAKGVAIKRVENTLQRSQLEHKLAESLKMSTVSMLLAEMPGMGYTTPAAVARVTDPEYVEPSAAAAEEGGEDADMTEELFNSQNRRLKLFYSEDLFPSFEALAQQVFELVGFPLADRKWDLSVESLFGLIKGIAERGARERCLDTLATLVKIAATPPSEASLQYAIAHTLLGDLANGFEAHAERTKAELRELGQYPPAPAPPEAGEEGQEPEHPPELSEAEQRQVASYVDSMGAAVKELLGESVNAFERMCAAGEAESRLMALDHFGLIPAPEQAEQEEEDDDDDDGSKSGVVPTLGTSAQMEQYSMSALNMSANVTGSQMYSSLVDGGGHTPQG
jgi:hypothetical protein